ncbi:hypothetical protein MYX82_03110 [Acidobacteria bacterium AH-259-D05]|nr:hypothetical protein [Acidobacteria bacterium AH-259-D05]
MVSVIPPLLILMGLLSGQERESKRKPVLIRADRTDESVEDIPLIPDPEKATEHVEIGNFYYHRHNYKAAADRYREAILHNPKWSEAYEKLIQALEKQKAFLEAVKVCEEFVEKNDSSAKVEYFQKWAKKLKGEEEKATQSE